ncbi:MAG: hypothetical protein ACLGH6_08890 [Gammaproteobacteria bacterium]
MHATRPLPLRLTPDRLADFCRQLRQRCPDPAQALQQLTAIQALIGIGVDDRADPAYVQAAAQLNAQIEELRAALLARHAADLATALRERDERHIARSFVALSRSGFAAAAAATWQQLETSARDECTRWLEAWCADAERRAAAASRYPDAPDFRAAGIDLETYLALQELRKTGIL